MSGRDVSQIDGNLCFRSILMGESDRSAFLCQEFKTQKTSKRLMPTIWDAP